MKPFGRWAILALAGALLAGCAPKEASTPQLPSGPNVQTDWSVLQEKEALPAVGERLYEQYTPELIPRDSYGPLLPFAGSQGLTLAWWEEEPAYTSPTWFYGLMTQDGTLVMDAVCSSITRCSYSQLDTATGTFSDYYLPVYALTQGDQERGRPGTGTLVALAAQDGSWWTDYRYWGVIAYPDGVAAGNQEGLTLLNAQTGETMGQYTWTQLGIEDPKAIPWFTGDAPGTAQWKDGRLFLGTYGETTQVARFLDPYTGEVSPPVRKSGFTSGTRTPTPAWTGFPWPMRTAPLPSPAGRSPTPSPPRCLRTNTPRCWGATGCTSSPGTKPAAVLPLPTWRETS